MEKQPRRLTNEIIDQRLKETDIQRVSDFVNQTTEMTWQCLKEDCGKTWEARCYKILNLNNTCKHCGSKRITNEIIDQRLLGRNIFRVDDYQGAVTKINFKCECGKTWLAKPKTIINDNRGCSKCSKKERITNETIDAYLVDKSIRRLDEYKGKNGLYAKWECLIHKGYIWSAPTSHVMRGYGCRKCGSKPLATNESIDERIVGREFIRIDDVIDCKTKIKWKCLIDGDTWEATPNSILRGSGCPSCKHKNETRIRMYLKEKYGSEEANRLTLNTNGRKYFIDFVVRGVFIEYNGEQHYSSIEFFGGEKRLIKQQKRDQELRDYCQQNNIRLIEIPYWLSEEEQYKLLEGL